jgi:hypothetical protein
MVDFGVWKLKGCRREIQKGQSSMYGMGTSGRHILLVCSENRYGASNLKCKKQLSLNDEIVYKNIII